MNVIATLPFGVRNFSRTACHCTECQRRTGSPFGVSTYVLKGEGAHRGAEQGLRARQRLGSKDRTVVLPQPRFQGVQCDPHDQWCRTRDRNVNGETRSTETHTRLQLNGRDTIVGARQQHRRAARNRYAAIRRRPWAWHALINPTRAWLSPAATLRNDVGRLQRIAQNW